MEMSPCPQRALRAARSNVPAAEAKARLFDRALERMAEARALFNNPCIDILAIGAEMMRGEIEYRKRNYATAFAHLRKSAASPAPIPAILLVSYFTMKAAVH